MPSHLQEYPVAIEEVEEQPPHQYVCRPVCQGIEVFGNKTENASEDGLKRFLCIQEMLCQIDGDGVHAHNSEEDSPLAPLHYIHNPVEGREEHHGQASRHEDKGTCP